MVTSTTTIGVSRVPSGGALRGPMVTTAMCIMSTAMATSTTTVLIGIPAEFSPYDNGSGSSYYINLSGYRAHHDAYSNDGGRALRTYITTTIRVV